MTTIILRPPIHCSRTACAAASPAPALEKIIPETSRTAHNDLALKVRQPSRPHQVVQDKSRSAASLLADASSTSECNAEVSLIAVVILHRNETGVTGN